MSDQVVYQSPDRSPFTAEQLRLAQEIQQHSEKMRFIACVLKHRDLRNLFPVVRNGNKDIYVGWSDFLSCNFQRNPLMLANKLSRLSLPSRL